MIIGSGLESGWCWECWAAGPPRFHHPEGLCYSCIGARRTNRNDLAKNRKPTRSSMKKPPPKIEWNSPKTPWLASKFCTEDHNGVGKLSRKNLDRVKELEKNPKNRIDSINGRRSGSSRPEDDTDPGPRIIARERKGRRWILSYLLGAGRSRAVRQRRAARYAASASTEMLWRFRFVGGGGGLQDGRRRRERRRGVVGSQSTEGGFFCDLRIWAVFTS
jgi:hypothetical protein